MDFIFNLCIAVTIGTIGGFIAGIWRLLAKKKQDGKLIEFEARMIKYIASALEYITILILLLGLIWCIYYLILGVRVPEQAEYATSISQLIVSVLTIISIIFAFFEFIRRR